MRLDEYISVTEGVTVGGFARQIGVDAVSVNRYCRGQRIPREPVMTAIVRATRGAVGPEDFYPEAARLLRRYRKSA